MKYIYIVRCTLFGKGSIEGAFSTKEKAEKYIENEKGRGLSILVTPIDVL